MNRQAYLTIDDTPSERTDDLVDALSARAVPAILFCRGDLLEKNPAPVMRAIQKGFVIGNHGYAHKRASILGYKTVTEGMEKTCRLIDDVYAMAGVARPGKYYRFAYMDRGMGAWFVEPATVKPGHRKMIESLIREGLGNDPSVLPGPAQIDVKKALQTFLISRGYSKIPVRDITHQFYTDSEMAGALDAMFTYSTADWAITARHRGRYGYVTTDDLKVRMDNDRALNRTDTAHIILAHDQAEIHDTVVALVDHMLQKKFTFRDFA